MPTVPVPENSSSDPSLQTLATALDGVNQLQQLAALMVHPTVGYAPLPARASVKGRDGLSLADHYLSAFDRHWQGISAGMRQASRKLFDASAADIRGDLAKRLQQHEAEQRQVLQSQAESNAKAQAAASAATNAADSADTAPEPFSAETFGRKVVVPVINHQLGENRVSDARAFLDKYRRDMTPDAANVLEARVADAEGYGNGPPVQLAAGYGGLHDDLRNLYFGKGVPETMTDAGPASDGNGWDPLMPHPDAAEQKALKTIAYRAKNPWVRFDDKRGTLVDIDPLDPRKQTPMTKTRMQTFLEGFFNTPNATTETLPKAFDDLVRKEPPEYDPRAKPKKATRQLKSPGEKLGPGDQLLLARMIFAETSDIPEDSPAVGWTMVNRIGDHEFGATLTDVLRQKNAYQIVPEGGGPAGGSAQWQATADPSKLTGADAASWAAAQQAAAGIVDGSISDPTDGATFFFSADDFDGNYKAAPGGFRSMLKRGTIQQGSYKSKSTRRRSNYFFIETKNK